MDSQEERLSSPIGEKEDTINSSTDNPLVDEENGKQSNLPENNRDIVKNAQAEHVLVEDTTCESVGGQEVSVHELSTPRSKLSLQDSCVEKNEEEARDNDLSANIGHMEVDQKHNEESCVDTDGRFEDTKAQETAAESQAEVEASESGLQEDPSDSEHLTEVQEAVEELAEMETTRSPVDWSSKPQLLAVAKQEYAGLKNNYLRGCKWSPDGTCLLTNSRDNILRLFNLPAPFSEENETPEEMHPVLRMKESDLIYDFCWYPLMSSNDPVSSCFLSTSRRHAIHLYDAYTGAIRCHYKPINHLDELEAAMSVAFSHDGSKIYAGFTNGVVRVFDLSRPGDHSERRPRLGQRRVQGGIISCIAAAPKSHLYAAGSYNRSVALYAEPGSMVAKLRGQGGGVTQLAFSPDARYLVSGGRKDPELLVWDLRRPGTILYTMLRRVGTNQRMYFDLNESGQQLITGNHSGLVSAFDFSCHKSSEISPVCEWTAFQDTCNGVSMNEHAALLATTSGQWNVPLPRLLTETGSSDSGEEDEPPVKVSRVEENCLKVWYYS